MGEPHTEIERNGHRLGVYDVNRFATDRDLNLLSKNERVVGALDEEIFERYVDQISADNGTDTLTEQEQPTRNTPPAPFCLDIERWA